MGSDSSFNDYPMVATEDSGTWSSASALTAAGISYFTGELTAVSCTSPGDCTAVGFGDGLGYQSFQPISVTEANGNWGPVTFVSVPNSLYSLFGFESVSCTSAGNCTAVGTTAGGSTYESTGFVASEANGTWGAATYLGPTTQDTNLELNGLSCASANNCVAVGIDDNDDLLETLPVEAIENNGSWTDPTDLVDAPPGSGLSSVSCPNAGNCTAVGFTDGDSTATPLVAELGTNGGEYVALGDSYSSGEGVGSYTADTNTTGSNECHRSMLAYPELVANAQGYGQSNLDFAACSGAVVANLWGINGNSSTPGTAGLPGQGGWNEGPQLAQVKSTDSLVTVSIGGNDIGFSSLALDCTEAHYAKVADGILKLLPKGGTGVKVAALLASATLKYEFPPCTDTDSNFQQMLAILQNGGLEQIIVDGNSVSDPQACPGGACPTPATPGTPYQVEVPSLTKLYETIAAQAPSAQIRVLEYPPLLPPNHPGCQYTVTGAVTASSTLYHPLKKSIPDP